MGHNQSVRRPHDAAFDHGSSLFQCLHIACSIERGTCIKGLFWPPIEPKTENCFSTISFDWFIRRITDV